MTVPEILQKHIEAQQMIQQRSPPSSDRLEGSVWRIFTRLGLVVAAA